MIQTPLPSPARRTFLSGLKAGIGALAVGSAARGQSKPAAAPWEPARHEKDNWLEKPSKHRLVFDTTTPEGFGEALLFAANYIRVNGADYGLQNSDLAVVIILRHRSTPFGFTSAMWAKYGGAMAAQAQFVDPKTKEAPKANIYDAQLEALAKQGVQIAVCSVATGVFAGAVARAMGGNAGAINGELVANRVGSALMVPAGIVAVNRAQERGYSLVRS